MTRSRKRKLARKSARWASMPLATALIAAGGAQAADSDTERSASGVLEEVTVTAQKRSEDLQKVPISLTVIGSEKLEQLEVQSFDDYAKFLPSVTFQSLAPGQAQLYFRGISSGEDGLHAGSLPATGVYLDETPLTTIGGNPDLHIYDIARVEALAGPQGTLYGASSLSGTLRIITNKPDASKFSASYDVKGDKFGSGGAGGSFEGMVNIPLAPNAAIRLVGYYEHDGGYIDNVFQQRTYERGAPGVPDSPITVNNAPYVKNDFNDVNTYGGRGAIKYDLNDNWTITPSVVYQHQQVNGNFSYDPKIGDLKVTDYRPDTELDHWFQSALTVEGKISNWDLVYSGGWYERRVDVETDYSEYTVAYDMEGLGYTRFTDNAGNLIDPTQYVIDHDKYTKQTHELRISSPLDYRFRFVGGAFYQRQTDDIRAEFRVDDLATDTGSPDQPAIVAVTGQPNILYLSQQDRTDRDYAVFGDSTFDITDKLKISAGIRGFVARNTLYGFFGFQTYEAFCTTPVNDNTNRPCVNTDKGVRDSGETHRVNLTYQLDPDVMLYSTWSTGFRPGGSNRLPNIVPFGADQLTNFEAGWKTSFLEHVRFNGAVFYEKWKDIQVTIPGQFGINSILNAGKARVKGIEADLAWLIIDNLTFSFGGTYVEAKTTTDFCPAANGAVVETCDDPTAPKGTRLPVTPQFKANATLRYKMDLGAYKTYVQGSVLHQSSSTSRLETGQNDALGDVPSFTSADFSAGGGMGNWNLEAFIQNAFDERGQLTRNSQCEIGYCYENPRIYPIKPRFFGVRFGQKF